MTSIRTISSASGPAIAALATATFAPHANALVQDCGWARQGASINGGSPTAAFDDGSGPALFVAATTLTPDGQAPINRMARFDGQTWADASAGLNEGVIDLEVLDDGSGPRLYALLDGRLSRDTAIATWNGASWDPMPVTGIGFDQIRAIAMYDDGSGPALYAGGRFDEIDGQPATNLARFDGETWTAVGDATWLSVREGILELAVHDDGTGPALIAAGEFGMFLDGQPTYGVVRYTASGYEPMGRGLDATISTLATHDDGSGPALYAGGDVIGGVRWWDGTAWSDPRQGVDGVVYDLLSYDDGRGPALYAAGSIDFTLGSPGRPAAYIGNLGRWDGSAWSSLGEGVNGPVDTLAAYDDGTGPALYASGPFQQSGTVRLDGFARYGVCLDCPTDLDGDGELTIFDFLTFQNLFDAGDPAADFDGDGALTIFDFLAFQNAFDAGCP
jgi:hypothetical protein